ncbi:lactate utilization protein [Candidatus Chloroploca sp. Khr17]|uniref:LutC/YkgG family protein n=1 Tax=Candidatus Chloroploca sp. Khr17 TaxID=2496869 RepID=UPI00101DF3D2|nr:lactate utilization protein [Candidatus Chloroploca sp. Khr17]
MSREQMLATLRTSLASNRAWLEAEAHKAPHTPPPFVLPPADDLAAQFAAELTKLEGRVYQVADHEEALETVATLLEERKATTAVAWDRAQIGLPGLDKLLAERGVQVLDPVVRDEARKAQLQVLEPAPVCLSGADFAIAESGSLVLYHGPGRPRLASLLAPTHIAVITSDQLVRGLGEAMARLRERYAGRLFDVTSNLTLISGPSRTADIEMTLSLGIHGPPELHVVLVQTP